jgi:hypothetical protein
MTRPRTARDIRTDISYMPCTVENLRAIIGAAETMAQSMKSAGIEPIQDKLIDAWSLCDYLDPPVLRDPREYSDEWAIVGYKESM